LRRAKAKDFYERRKHLLQQQIDIRESQLESRGKEDDKYRKEKETQYTYQMCSMLMDAFFFDDDQTKRIKVLELCMGRKSLAHLQTAGSNSTTNTSHLLEGPSLLTALSELEAQTQVLTTAETRLEKTGRLLRGPADNMRGILRRLEQEEVAARSQLSSDVADWKAKIEKLQKREDALGDKVLESHQQKSLVKKQSWQKVMNHFCPVINRAYRIDNDAIVEHAIESCK